MNKTIILLAGEARAGKDTSADCIQTILNDFDITHDRAFFAEALKESAKAVFRMNDDHVYGHLKEVEGLFPLKSSEMYQLTLDQLTHGHLSFIPSRMQNCSVAEIAARITTEMCRAIQSKGKPLTYSAPLIDNDVYGVSPRQMMQWWGTEAVRIGAYENAWIDSVQAKIDKSDARVFIISDTRFDNEAEQITKNNLPNKALCIRVHRGEKVKVNQHVSEAGISDHFVNYEVTNNGSITDLTEKLQDILFDDNESGDLKWLDN